jgi:hypothetical protein
LKKFSKFCFCFFLGLVLIGTISSQTNSVRIPEVGASFVLDPSMRIGSTHPSGFTLVAENSLRYISPKKDIEFALISWDKVELVVLNNRVQAVFYSMNDSAGNTSTNIGLFAGFFFLSEGCTPKQGVLTSTGTQVQVQCTLYPYPDGSKFGVVTYNGITIYNGGNYSRIFREQ